MSSRHKRLKWKSEQTYFIESIFDETWLVKLEYLSIYK